MRQLVAEHQKSIVENEAACSIEISRSEGQFWIDQDKYTMEASRTAHRYAEHGEGPVAYSFHDDSWRRARRFEFLANEV